MNEIIIAEKKYIVLELPNRPRALLDRHVAEMFEVETREINQAIKNNPERFPEDFYFELTSEEAKCLSNINNIDFVWSGGHRPKALTHEGCNMLAGILRSDIAIKRSLDIMRSFTLMEKRMMESPVVEHPLMAQANQVIQQAKLVQELTRRFLAMEAEQKKQAAIQQEQAEKLKQIEAKQDAILKQTDYYSIMGYANLKGLKVSLTLAKQMGKIAVQLSNLIGAPLDKVPDPRFGSVNAYHQSILEKVFNERFKS